MRMKSNLTKMNSNSERISVIIPMYNAEPFIERCVRSVLNGIYQNIEILCIDDGSTDGTLDLVRHLRDEDKRIIVLEQDHAGVSAARNHGLRKAKGNYIAFIDSDDWVSPDYLSLMAEIAEEKNVDIVNCGFFGVNAVPKKQFEDNAEYQIQPITEKRKNKDLVTHVWSALYRREICPQFNEEVLVGEDLLFNIRLLSEHTDISAWKCTKRVYFHLWRPNSLITTTGIERYGRVCRDILKEMNSLPTKRYALINAAREALGFKYCIESSRAADQYRNQADELLKEVRRLLLKSHDVPFSEKALFLPFLYSPRLYSVYRRHSN